MKGCGPALRKTTPTTPSGPWWGTSPLSEETVSELSLEVVAALQVSWLARGEEGTAGGGHDMCESE